MRSFSDITEKLGLARKHIAEVEHEVWMLKQDIETRSALVAPVDEQGHAYWPGGDDWARAAEHDRALAEDLQLVWLRERLAEVRKNLARRQAEAAELETEFDGAKWEIRQRLVRRGSLPTVRWQHHGND